MADKRGLEIVGVVFGLVTAMVMMIGAVVVKANFDGGVTADSRPLVSASIASIVR